MSESAAVGTLWSPGATVSVPLLEVDGLTVLHRGKVVERGPTARVLDDPQDPYTQRLRASVPRPGWKPGHRALPGAGEEPDAS